MNTTLPAESNRSSTPTTSTTGPLVFQYETPHGHRYHIAGHGFTARDPRHATRYPVDASWHDVALNPFIPDGGHLAALALVDIAAIEETAIHASWGDKSFVLSPTNFHSEAFAIIRPLLDGLVTSGGTPFGSTLMVSESHRTKRHGAIFNIAFLLPPGMDELLTPLSPFGARTPREILARIALLGFTLKKRSEPQGFSIWERELGGLTLLLETGFACAPESVTLRAKEAHPVTIGLAGRTFTEIHPLLASCIITTKSASPAQVLESFKETFGNPV